MRTTTEREPPLRSSRWAFQPKGLIGCILGRINWVLMKAGWAIGFGPVREDGTPADARSFSVVRWP